MLDRLENLVKAVGTFCLASLFMLILLQVVLRYGFDRSYFFTEELGRYLLIWMTMAGMSLQCRHEGHIRVDFMLQRLRGKTRLYLEIVVNILVSAILFVVVYTGIMSTIFNHGQESPGMQIPLSFPFLAVPLFFTIAVVFLVDRTLCRFKKGQ